MDVCSQCWSSYGTFLAGIVASGIIAIVMDELRMRKVELERIENQWKLPPYVYKHRDVMDNNSIPGGP
jgi:hypothetical protein